MQDYQEAMLKSLVAVAWADGQLHGEESDIIDGLLAVYEIAGKDAETIRAFAKTKRTLDDVPLTELSIDDRRQLLQHAILVTYADGQQTSAETAVIDALIKKLRLEAEDAQKIREATDARAKRLTKLL
ncbi:MAG: TerB family tellurite resistance protein [Sandaracinaceae bacterium]|jgi:uncharacterized tellurite resistance protein B-like protein|nr:TerB family tellurite resistance protein [Sandaracinaceae bacterium]